MFHIFKKKKITEEQEKWNIMWDLWARGEIESPYKELMTYESEVNNGGHSQYFINTEHIDDLEHEMEVLKQILPWKFIENLEKAYKVHRILDKNDEDENAEILMEECDAFFFDNEEKILYILEGFAHTMLVKTYID